MMSSRLLLLLCIALFLRTGWAAPITVENLRLWQAPDHSRLVFDVSGPLEYRLFSLAGPDRIVIDMDDARLSGRFPALSPDDRYLSAVRTAARNQGLRVVLDLKRSVKPRTFVLKPGGNYGHRLVIDLYDEGKTQAVVIPQAPPRRRSYYLIAIDAGHGGEDPGAIGKRYRTREKHVVLAIAKELARLVRRAPGMKPLMIRKGDYYVGLGERPRIARAQRADIFVSIHADAVPHRRARGSSVYALTERGASDRISKYLASSENAADLSGGVLDDHSGQDKLLKTVLLDLQQTKIIDYSLDLGHDVLRELKRVGPVHKASVGQAGFAVLKSPSIPSILVETAFISNAKEERKLRSKAFQRKIARGILNGIKRFLAKKDFQPQGVPTTQARRPQKNAKPPQDKRQYVVRKGDTLSAIAQRYNVHVDALRFANNLHSNTLYVGKKLLIP